MGHTEHYNKFFTDITKLIYFVGFGLHDAQSYEKTMRQHIELAQTVKMEEIVVEHDKEIRKEIPDDEKKDFIKSLEDQMKNREYYFDFILSHSLIFAKSLFDNYISNVIEFIYNTYPSILTSKKKQIYYSEVFEHDTMEELLNYIIEKELYDIGYMSFRALETYFEDILCLKLILDESDIKKIIKIFEIRNIYVHNNGVVNKKFIRMVKSDDYKEGDEIKLNFQLVVNYFLIIRRVTNALDMQIYNKFYKDSE